MPRKYVRKATAAKRAFWFEEQLLKAIEEIEACEITRREAHRGFSFPSRALKRRVSKDPSDLTVNY